MDADEPFHFPDQQSLLQVALGIRALAEETHTDLSDLFDWDKLHNELAAPFSLIAIGAVNSGKSSLINALFRAPLAKVSKLPDTSTITLHHSLPQAPALASLSGVVPAHHHYPPSLREFAVIDTPGANRLEESQIATIHQLLRQCDWILALLPTSDPWSPGTWDLISSIPPDRIDRLILILQHADLRSPDDIRVLTGHLSALADKRCGMVPPILPMALPQTPVTDTAWNASGCAALWQLILQGAGHDPLRRQKISRWKEISQLALNRLDHTIDGFDSEISRKSRFHAQCQDHLDGIRAHFLGQLDGGIDELERSLQAEGRLVARFLRKKLAIPPSLFRLFGKDHTAADVEVEYRARLNAAIEDIGHEDAEAVSLACLDHWQSTRDGADGHGITLDNQNLQPARAMEEAAARFISTLEQSVNERLECIHLRNQLVRELRRRNRALGAFTASALLSLILAGISGAMTIPWLPYLLCGLALLFAIGAIVVGIRTKKPVIESFLRLQAEACTAFAKSLHTCYETALIGMFQSYGNLLIPLHRDIARHEALIKPLQKRWQELFLQLKSIE